MRVALPKPEFRLPSLPFLKKKPRTATSVYVGNKIIRVLSINEERKPLFEPVEVLLETDSEEEKIKALSKIVESNGLAGKDVISCITVDDGILKFQKFPAAIPKKELKEAIDFFVRTETKAIKEETVYDYYIFERKEDDKYIRVVITIARKSAVDRLKSLLGKAGLNLKIVDYEVTAIINYGLAHNLPPPFAILYIDYYDSILVYYSENTITYNKIDFDYRFYKDTGDTTLFDTFLIDVRNYLVINEISNIYIAGTIISDEASLENIMTNLPVLGILDIENIPPSFFIPYTLALREIREE